WRHVCSSSVRISSSELVTGGASHMQRRQLARCWFGSVSVFFVLASTSVAVRGQKAPTGEIVSSSGVISPIVEDSDRSLQFYHGLLGLEAPTRRVASAKASPPPPLLNLQGTPDGRMRWSHVTFPGTQWWAEPLEY